MEKKNSLGGLFNIFCVDLELIYGTLDRSFVNNFLKIVRIRADIVSTSFLWLLWNTFESACFGLLMDAFYTRRLGLSLQRLWLCVLTYFGDRCLTGTRRMALRGLVCKQRYVTRYNYKSYNQYLWRRHQRRWRLFLMRRMPRFFFRRYKKFRRFRYDLSFSFAYRLQQNLMPFRFRRLGSKLRLMSFNLLFWRALVLNKARWRVKIGTVLLWRRVMQFSMIRWNKRCKPFTAQFVLYRAPSRLKRFFLSQRTRQIGLYNQLSRVGVFSKSSSSDCSYRQRYKQLLTFRVLRRLSLGKRLHIRGFRGGSNRLGVGVVAIKSRFVRLHYRREYSRLRRLRSTRLWRRRLPRQMWRFLRKRRRYLRLRLSQFILKKRRMQKRLLNQLRRIRFNRRVRRRIKRRKKRRIRYLGKWAKRYILGRRRQIRLASRRRLRVVRKLSCGLTSRKLLPQLLRFPVKRTARVQFWQPTSFTVPSLMAVAKFQTRWRRSSEGISIRNQASYNRLLSRRYIQWVEDAPPRKVLLRGYAQSIRIGPLGRYKGWLKALFLRGNRLFYYKELKRPFAQLIKKRSFDSTLRCRPSVYLGGSVRASFLQGLVRKRRLRRVRQRFLQLRRRVITRPSRRKVQYSSRLRRRKNVFRLRWYKIRNVRFLWMRRRQRGVRLITRHRFSFYRYWFAKRRGLILMLRRQFVLRRLALMTRFRTLSFFKRFTNWKYDIKQVRQFRYIKSRRVFERYLGRRQRQLLLFRLRFLQSNATHTLRRVAVNAAKRRALQSFFITMRKKRRLHVFSGSIRLYFVNYFQRVLAQKLQQTIRQSALIQTNLGNSFSRNYLMRQRKNKRISSLLVPSAELAVPVNPHVTKYSRSQSVYRVSRYFVKQGFTNLNAHFLLTRRYPSVYDFETFNYLFASTFFYKKFIQMGKKWRSQILILSVLRYFRPYSSYHLIRFIKKFLIEGFPIFFEMSSLKQSNKEQPFPVPINLLYFQNYMLKALVTRFRAKRHSVCFQAALLLELWSWHVDPTISILHDFLINHYALGLDSRFFVHYRWRVNR